MGKLRDYDHYTPLEVAMRIATVAERTGRLPRASALMDQFGMSKATAFRWLQLLRAVRGVPDPPLSIRMSEIQRSRTSTGRFDGRERCSPNP